jgi:hypothetical protein
LKGSFVLKFRRKVGETYEVLIVANGTSDMIAGEGPWVIAAQKSPVLLAEIKDLIEVVVQPLKLYNAPSGSFSVCVFGIQESQSTGKGWKRKIAREVHRQSVIAVRKLSKRQQRKQR